MTEPLLATDLPRLFSRFGNEQGLTAPKNGCAQTLRRDDPFAKIVGCHPGMLQVLKIVAKVADSEATVLIQGESGTGKELIALALHDHSRRNLRPFVPINCAALPEHLLESELFGHVRGAFTGAIKDRQGWFEFAEGGTIFLDEVNDMPPELQVKLLRILQTGEFSRVGSTALNRCHVRVVAATSVDLQQLILQKKFRQEVFYRLNVIDINLPPLRERKSDVPLLAEHFVKHYGAKYDKKNLRFSSEAEALLLAHDFPGNVRELENLVQRAVIWAEGETIEPNHIPLSFRQAPPALTSGVPPFKAAKQMIVENFERQYFTDCLHTAKGNITQAAKLADLHVTNFYVKLKKYRLEPEEFRG